MRRQERQKSEELTAKRAPESTERNLLFHASVTLSMKHTTTETFPVDTQTSE